MLSYRKEIIYTLLVFLVAFFVRYLAWKMLGSLFNAKCGDSIEYYITSINLEPHTFFKLLWGYEHWYQRTPAYVLFLHLIERNLIVQIFLSSLGCVLMYRINNIAGLLWTFYPQDIIHSFQYNKECLFVFCIILSIFILKNKKFYLTLIYILITLLFVSYGWISNGQHNTGNNMMRNFWSLWQPSFNTSIGYSKFFVYLQFLPYIIGMFYFIRNITIQHEAFYIFIILSVSYSLIYGEPRFREPFMPYIFLFCAQAKIFEKITTYFKNIFSYSNNIIFRTIN